MFLSFLTLWLDIGQKSQFFLTPLVGPFVAAVECRSLMSLSRGWNFCLEGLPYSQPTVQRRWLDVWFNRFDKIYECDGRMDGQTSP